MRSSNRSLLTLLCLVPLTSPVIPAATIDQCIGHCAIWRWGPSRTDSSHTERQPSQTGTWNGHTGVFDYWDLKLELDPYVWYSLADYTPTGPMGPAVPVGSQSFILTREWLGGVMFTWTAPDGSPQIEVITPPVIVSNTEMHAVYLWQCEQGIDPPYPPEPWPEPGTFWVMATGLGALAAGRLRR